MRIVRLIAFIFVIFSSAIAHSAERRFLVVSHMNGSLAINTDRIESIWYRDAFGEKPAVVRIVYEGADAKSVEGLEASGLVERLQAADFQRPFVWVSHLGGTLGIPRGAIRTLFYTEASGSAPVRVRIVHGPGSESKVVEGDEAISLWKSVGG
ncbi:MAG TPA: hypothetical protein VMT00_15620 [Thermoanaerobaculia bacterium]|nr:hypothetical protein [Thermoanaerobaculia bacterium]